MTENHSMSMPNWMKLLLLLELGAFALAMVERPHDVFFPSLADIVIDNPTPGEQVLCDFLINNLFLAALFSLGWVLSLRSNRAKHPDPRKAVYSVSLRGQLSCLSPLFVGGILAVIISLFVLHEFGSSDVLVCTLAFLVLFQVIPPLILHSQYYELNKDFELQVDNASRIMAIRQNEINLHIPFDNIKTITIVLSWERDASWSGYQYTVLVTHTGQRFLISCLIVRNLREFFNDLGLTFAVERSLFPFVRRDHMPSLAAA